MPFLNRTSNPAFSNYLWGKYNIKNSNNKMSVRGVFLKSILGLILTLISIGYIWKLFYKGVDVQWFLYGGMMAAVIFSVLISFRPYQFRFLVIFYAIAKGCFLGAISVYAHKKIPEVPFKAVVITLIAFLIMLLLYSLRIIKVTQQFKSVIIGASITIFSIYFFNWIIGFFNIAQPILWGTSWSSIIFNTIAAIIASLALLLDFDYINKQVGKAPKWKEWLAVWGLLVTLIWLYIEVLRLIRKLAIKL